MRYTMTFKSESGLTVVFSMPSGIVLKKNDLLSGVNAKFETATPSDGVGETISATFVSATLGTLSGTILANVQNTKRNLLKAFAPRAKGRLTIGEYYLDVAVKMSPEIERHETAPAFQIILEAAYPMWRKTKVNPVNLIGRTAAFRFPWNLSTTYRWSTSKVEAYTNAYNHGDVDATWTLRIYAKSEVQNPKVLNIDTNEHIEILKTLAVGELITIKTAGGKFVASGKLLDGSTYDAGLNLTYTSTPFPLRPGDNLLKVEAESNVQGLSVQITADEAVAGLAI